jgi:hypothetical protein
MAPDSQVFGVLWVMPSNILELLHCWKMQGTTTKILIEFSLQDWAVSFVPNFSSSGLVDLVNFSCTRAFPLL